MPLIIITSPERIAQRQAVRKSLRERYKLRTASTAVAERIAKENSAWPLATASLGAPGFIYLIKLDDFYKIGRTVTSVEMRIGNLQSACPYKLKLVHSSPVKASLIVEQALHLEYARFRGQGEWFKLPKCCVADIKQMSPDDYLILANKYLPESRRFTVG